MPEIAYHRPDTLAQALSLLQSGQHRIAAGCTDLFPATQAPALDGPVLDITGIDDLRGISRTDDGLRMGATTRWADVIKANLPPAFDMLKAAAREVGSVQIQNSATLAGNLCNASPAADGVPCLLALDAQVELASENGHRILPLSEFLTGPRRTALRPDEILTAIEVPAQACQGRSSFRKLGARKYLVISIAMVATRLVVQDDKVAEAAISVGSCSAVATRLPELEQALVGRTADRALPDIATPDVIARRLSPIDDIRADAGYRTRAAAELVKRTLRDIATREVPA